MSQAVRHNSDNRFLPVKISFKSYIDLETAVFGLRISATIILIRKAGLGG
jgi:hypothetical protein